VRLWQDDGFRSSTETIWYDTVRCQCGKRPVTWREANGDYPTGNSGDGAGLGSLWVLNADRDGTVSVCTVTKTAVVVVAPTVHAASNRGARTKITSGNLGCSRR
jgi:hypothetical protein